MKKILAMLLASMMCLSTAACGSKSEAPAEAAPEAAESETIVLGGLAPLTGAVSVYGIATANGVKLAIDEINAAGGVMGKQVVINILDEKGDPTEAVNAYNKLVDEGMVALIGDVTSKPCAAVAEVAVEDNIPMITPTGTMADITPIGDNVFRACFTDPGQGTIMATFAAEKLEAKSVAVLYNTSDDYSQGIAETFKKDAEEKGMTVVAYEGYGASDTDFKTQLTNIADSNPDAIMIPDYYEKVALIAAQAREVGYTGALLGGDGWDGVLTVLDESKLDVVNGSYYACHIFKEDVENERLQKFLADYKEKYGEEANSFAALGYDAAYIMCNAIGAAGSTDADAIVAALNETNYSGITGDITFDEIGNPIKSTSIITLVDGKEALETKVMA
ncbi:MAG: ABC transporter substrate-binding protein [Oscillospiraceae bacterium]|nr:ABC transporter substrate-binding protein [Oscillospiraceae bacterium]